MSGPASISSGVAARYATAIFEIAQESQDLAGLEKGIDVLAEALNVSDDLRAMITSPVISRTEQEGAISAVAVHLKLPQDLARGLALMAQKRRLFALPQLIAQLRGLIGAEKGEVQAEVVTAKALTRTQAEKLVKTLKSNIGKDVRINATVNKDIIGGLIVKVGSRMIDTSIRSRLASLQNSMKEVG